MFKKAAICLILLSSVASAKLVVIDDDKEMTMALDTNSVKRNGDLTKINAIVTPKGAQSSLKVVINYEVNCKKETFRITNVIAYDAKGKELKRTRSESQPFRPLGRDAAEITDIACK
jgi:hypothetical protein